MKFGRMVLKRSIPVIMALLCCDDGPPPEATCRAGPPSERDRAAPTREAHRAEPLQCETERPCIEVNPGPDCAAHSDCRDGENGRCQRFGFECTYDECFSDADCDPGFICDCAGGLNGSHRCLRAVCSRDADCGGGNGCSPSPDPQCPNLDAAVGYFCHTPDDECTTDADCSGWCVFDPARSGWRCVELGCITR